MNQGGLFDDFKNAWNKPDNGLIQLIIVNAIVFVVFGVFEVFSLWSGNGSFYASVSSYITLPSV